MICLLYDRVLLKNLSNTYGRAFMLKAVHHLSRVLQASASASKK